MLDIVFSNSEHGAALGQLALPASANRNSFLNLPPTAKNVKQALRLFKVRSL